MELEESLISEATSAEIAQHWGQAAILWRRLGEIANAEVCENILQHLAESNLDQLSVKKRYV